MKKKQQHRNKTTIWIAFKLIELYNFFGQHFDSIEHILGWIKQKKN